MVVSRNKLRARSAARRGFTIAELIVASSVMTTALLGVYTLFGQVIDVERRASLRWEQRGAAEAVASQLAEAVEYAVDLPNITAIGGGDGEDGSSSLTVMTSARPGSPSFGGQAGLQRRLYRWHPDTRTIELKTQRYAGSVNLTPGVTGEEADDEVVWSRSAAVVVAGDVDGLTLRFRTADDPQGEWTKQRRGAARNVAVLIRVKVGEQTVERIVASQVNQPLLSGEARESR